MRTVVCGIGICGGFGVGVAAFLEALEKGESVPGAVTVRTAQGPMQGTAFLADTSRLADYVDRKALRRMDHYSKLALLAAHLAWEDAGNPSWDRSKTGLVLASGYGALRTTFAFLDSFIEAGDKFSSPTPFSHSVHNAALAQVSMVLGITGPGLTVSQFELSVPSALLTARTWLEEGRVESLLFGAVDEFSEVLGHGWYRFFGPWSGTMEPLDWERQTAVPGEGAVFFLLAPEGKALRSPYAALERVRTGRGAYDPGELPPEALLLLGADGHQGCGTYYRRVSGLPRPIVCYSPLYGSFPAAAAFDMAAAALMIREGRFFGPIHGSGARPVSGTFSAGSVICLKMGPEGEWGEILLHP